MLRHTPLHQLDIVGPLGLSPQDAGGLCIESKQQYKVLTKPPNWDSPGDSIELLAIANGRELETMQRLQNELRAEIKHQGDINQDRIEEILKMQGHLRKEFGIVNNYMKECEEKKTKAEQRVSGERKKHEHYKAIIRKYKTDLEVLTKFRNELTKTVKDMEPYETSIQQVVAETGVYTSVKDCMDRCDALMLVQTEINNSKRETFLKIEAKRLDMVRLSREAALTIMAFINELAQLERDYYRARHACLNWEKILSNVKNFLLEQELNKTRMLEGLMLLHRTLCHRRGIQPLTIGPEKRLDFIRDEIQIIQQVLVECTGKQQI